MEQQPIGWIKNRPVYAWTNIDKSKWGDGPWQHEADKQQWVDPLTGLDCLIVRHETSGHLCGYVGVPQSHPLFGKPYQEVEAKVHGGLTFSEGCHPDPRGPGFGICHVTEDGREVWWFGFDCNHGWDSAPGREALYRSVGFESPLFQPPQAQYRTLNYVEQECESLATQLMGGA